MIRFNDTILQKNTLNPLKQQQLKQISDVFQLIETLARSNNLPTKMTFW